MADIVSPEKRSRMMSRIRSKNTRPEILIRRHLHYQGFRYRLHDKKLPGAPDLCFPRYKAVIFIHGCFWHVHDCHLFKWPSTREEFWRAKLGNNRTRDDEAVKILSTLGWRVCIVWECALKGRTRMNIGDLVNQVTNWLLHGESNLELKGR